MAVVINPICEELAVQRMHPPQHIYAIDFSGAQDAGKKIPVSKNIRAATAW